LQIDRRHYLPDVVDRRPRPDAGPPVSLRFASGDEECRVLALGHDHVAMG
jgi:hypothetical protein